ncbi:MAG TPA: hypothetical protein VEX13_02675 [Chloroflexia bacterium]|nr:hypothetical protein [Chloroflexia bacterium]
MSKYRIPSLIRLFLPLLILAAASTLALLLAYQARPAYTLRMDRSFDRHYLPEGWHDMERSGDDTYRWTTGRAIAHVEGAARQPFKLVMRMNTAGIDPQPSKQVQVHARGALVAIFTATNQPTTFEAPISPDLTSRATGDLDLTITTEAFTPPGDPRDLGVSVSLLSIEPSGSPGLVLPPLDHLLYLLGIAFSLYLITTLLGLTPRLRLPIALAAVAIITIFYTIARPYIAFYAPGLLATLVLSLLALLIAQPVVTFFYRRGSLKDFHKHAPQSQALFGLYTAGLLVGWGGLLYPQSVPHDFGFHLHRFQEVQNGNLFFANYVVSGIGQGFYPPAMYVLLLPFNLIVQNDYFLVRLAPVLFSFSAIFLVYYLARRYFAHYPAAPLLASTLYTIMPIHLLLIWWAHETNLFGLVVLFATIFYIIEQYPRITGWPAWLGLVALSFILLLSHPGVLVWSLLLLSALLLAFLALRRLTCRGSYKSILAVAAALLVAGALAFLLYYSRYTGIFGQEAYVEGRGGSELSDTLSDLGDLHDVLNMARLTLYHGVLADYGLFPLLLVPVALFILFKKPPPPHQPLSDPANERFRWTLLTWLLVGIALLAVNFLTALPIRPMLLIWPTVSLLSGLALAAFLQPATHPYQTWRKAAVALLLTFLTLLSLYLWTLANFLDQREPHLFPHVF